MLVEEGDLTRLLPKLRLGELDLFMGRLEPGYASPDLVTEVLYEDTMAVVVRPGHPLTQKQVVTWADLDSLRFVVPPPWASLRVKLDQQFFKYGLQPPHDVVETASFLAQITFVREQGAAALMAKSVAQHFAAQGLVEPLQLPVSVDLPPVGLITVRGRPLTPITQRLVDITRELVRTR